MLFFEIGRSICSQRDVKCRSREITNLPSVRNSNDWRVDFSVFKASVQLVITNQTRLRDRAECILR